MGRVQLCFDQAARSAAWSDVSDAAEELAHASVLLSSIQVDLEDMYRCSSTRLAATTCLFAVPF